MGIVFAADRHVRSVGERRRRRARHGLDLTAADLIVWYAPHNSNEQYLQACARIDGSKQKTKIDIAHIYATKVERKAFENLRQRGNWQKVLLDIVKEGGL